MYTAPRITIGRSPSRISYACNPAYDSSAPSRPSAPASTIQRTTMPDHGDGGDGDDRRPAVRTDAAARWRDAGRIDCGRGIAHDSAGSLTRVSRLAKLLRRVARLPGVPQSPPCRRASRRTVPPGRSRRRCTANSSRRSSGSTPSRAARELRTRSRRSSNISRRCSTRSCRRTATARVMRRELETVRRARELRLTLDTRHLVMRVSVVICTYNRAESLQRTLDALRYQTFTRLRSRRRQRSVDRSTPTTCSTSWRHAVKVVDEPARQPLGLPEPRHPGSRQATSSRSSTTTRSPSSTGSTTSSPRSTDDEVAGVGGLVFDHTGIDFQFRFSASSRLGEPLLSDVAPFDELCVPGAFGSRTCRARTPCSGAPCSTRSAASTRRSTTTSTRPTCARASSTPATSCARLDDAHVHHKFLPSAVRNEGRIVTNWYPIIKNLTYFGYPPRPRRCR